MPNKQALPRQAPFEDNIIGHLSNGLGDVDEAQESYDFRPLRFGRPLSLLDPYSC
jgi:hypothetical protein